MTRKKKSNQNLPTPAQQAARDHFRAATQYAKQLLQNADRKNYYAHQAYEKGLPNAYVAAVTEYLRNTPAMAITGTVKRALQVTNHQTQPVKMAETRPVVKRASAQRKPAKRNAKAVTKSAKRNVMAVCQMPGLSMAVACSGSVVAGKMKARKSRTGSVTFTTTFYCD